MTPQSTLKTTPKANHNKKQGAKSAKASPSAPVATYSGRGNQTIVRKSNDLIQNAMYSLSLSQQKLMLHIFAMIKPSDTELPRYEMSIYEFLKLCGVDPHNGSMYKQVKKNIEDIANAKVQWIRLAGTQKITMFRWLSSATIDRGHRQDRADARPVAQAAPDPAKRVLHNDEYHLYAPDEEPV